MNLRTMLDMDQEKVIEIYREGIQSGHATFTSDVPTWQEWDASYRRDCRIVAEEGGDVVGWAALKPVSSRPVYSGVTDISIYVAEGRSGEGIGGAMMAEIVRVSETVGVWTIRAHMFPENKVSERLHARFGFRVLGVCEKQGKMDLGPYAGQWRDVLLMERRSKIVGIE
jgi:phosphinothricin acetyltransferase